MAQKIIGEDGEIYAYKNKKPFYKKWWFIALIVTALIIVTIVKFGGQVIAIYLLMFLLLAMIIQGIRTLFVILQKDDKNIQKNAKIFAVIFGFALFLVYSIIATTPEKDKVANNKTEVKKVETKKEEPKVETKTTTTEVEADPYKEIEANIKRKFPKTRKIVATDVGVILEIQAKGGFAKNMMVKEMFRDARKYINEINKQYKKKHLKYESMALQFFYPMSDGETSGNMKILQLDVDNDMIEVGFVMPTIAEEVKQNFK